MSTLFRVCYYGMAILFGLCFAYVIYLMLLTFMQGYVSNKMESCIIGDPNSTSNVMIGEASEVVPENLAPDIDEGYISD